MRRSSRGLVAGCLLAGTAFLGPWAVAQSAPDADDFKSAIRSDTFPLQDALLGAADQLFGGLMPGQGWAERLYEVPQFRSGAEFEKYRITSEDRGVIGEMLRMRIYHDDGTVVDLALDPGADNIGRTAFVRPLKLGDKPVEGFDRVLERLRPYAISDYAQPLSKLFESLVYVVKSSEGTSGPSLTPEQAAAVCLTTDKEHPLMPAGTKMPAFAATDLSGKSVTPATFKGKRAILVAASVTHRMSRDIMGWVQRYTHSHSGRFLVADILDDQEDSVQEYLRRGGLLDGLAIVDSDHQLQDRLDVGFIPALYVFDAAGVNIKTLRGPWKTYDALARELDAVP
jgi:hypothetical protein